ncbi:hypothetical protein PA0527 [Candidatus Phytoplasma australiense]|uniref:Uncharacterized protein n=1 Tax=Phytoplasma australiense TaxID=59748 RepID=B1VA88_PHYAS|nr:hypothetical protein PA0527 [Candidatus Phytoplasma australiense]
MSAGNFVASGLNVVVNNRLSQLTADLVSNNLVVLENSQNIREIEYLFMGAIDIVDDVPIVRNVARSGLEVFKTFGKAVNYPTNFFEGVINGVNDQNYKPIEIPLDLLKNTGRLTEGAVVGVAEATINTSKDICYGFKDIFSKLFSW